MNVLNALALLNISVDHIQIIAANRKQLEKRIKKQKQGIGFLMALLMLVGLIALTVLLSNF